MEREAAVNVDISKSGDIHASRPAGRDSSLELLRIFAMILVVASHLACHSMGNGWKMWELPFSANQAWSIALGRWGNFGVELFIILSSWFMCDRKGIRSRRLLDLAFQTVTTCIVFFFFIRLTHLNMVGKKALLEECLELFRSQNYWFIPAYMVFFALIPFMQLVSCRKGAAFRLVVVWTALTLIFRSYRPWWTPFFGRVGHFAYLYFITAWLKEAEENARANGRKGHFIGCHAGLISLACYALLVFEACWSRYRISSGLEAFALPFRISEWLTLLFEFSLFYLFKKFRLKESRPINALAGTVFGVYLLHENFLWMSWENHEQYSILWDQLLRAGAWYESPLFPAYYVCATLIVFAACAAVEFVLAWLRRLVLSRCPWLDPLCGTFDAWYAGDEG